MIIVEGPLDLLAYKTVLSEAVNLELNNIAIVSAWGKDPITAIVQLCKRFDIPYFVNCSAEHLPFRDHVFDTVIMAEILEHVPEWEPVFEEGVRVNRFQMIVTVPDTRLWDKQTIEEGETEYFHENYERLMKPIIDGYEGSVIYDDRKYPHLYHQRRASIGMFIDTFDKKYFIIHIRTTPLTNKNGYLQFAITPYILFHLEYVIKE